MCIYNCDKMVLSLNHYAYSWVLRCLASWHVGMLACWHLTCCAGLAILQVVASWTPGLLCSSTLVCWLLDTLCWTPWTPGLLMDSWTPHGLLMDSLWTPHPGGLAAICSFTLYQVMGIHATKGLSSI